MAAPNIQQPNNDVDSDNDTQMSQQDNDNNTNIAPNNDPNDTNNNPATNIDNASASNPNPAPPQQPQQPQPPNDKDDDNDTQIADNDPDDTTNNASPPQPSKSNNDNPPAANNNDNNDDAKNDDNPSSANNPQYKYVWQWLENDGTWHDYDASTQLLLDQLSIGHKISIQAGRFTYDITKTSTDACSQLNTQTNNTRQARRAKVLIVAPLPAHNNGHNYIGNGQYVFLWQFLENDNKWKDLGYAVASKLEQLPLHGTAKYGFGQYNYTVQKISKDECTQTNDQTGNQRDLRRILFDTSNNKRIVWQFADDKGGWSAIDSNDLMVQLLKLPVGSNMNHARGQWKYIITKDDASHATQKNTKTQKTRQFKMVYKDKDEMDSNWSSKASTNNQNYQAGYKQTVAQYGGGMGGMGGFGANWGGIFGRLVAAQDDDDEDAPKEIIKLDPNDVQDIIMADDLAELNKNDMNDGDNGGNKNKNDDNKRSRFRGLFGKKNKNNKKKVDSDDDEEEEEVNGGGDEENDDDKKEDANKSERVLMGDDDRNIYNEFCKTLTRDSVQVLSIQKIKDNAAKTIVYNALLTAKKDELKSKNIQHIERVLFHGTSFANIAKIVNNGFNRDFNRHHLYGKGTYFSSLASESAKYCENDDNEDEEKYVMLVCRVIIGEFTKGTHDMDGSSIPYKPDKKTQYESCVNNIAAPTIFVINRDYHAIPTHIITFKYKK